eukprot:TRINITY_DN10132_c0_g1_i7.p1 TRINITY_DN10132_c0_g1~~TRINITY_DN10132_c0_g1_i7.p1  ORF type:complete len:110 (+),score=3.22 TRINITY_DN10132_c0_g1_i7:258-587(+)
MPISHDLSPTNDVHFAQSTTQRVLQSSVSCSFIWQFDKQQFTLHLCLILRIIAITNSGNGNWFNCCGSNDYEAPGCMTGPHSDQVDDFDIRGHSNDALKPEDLPPRDQT